jgi:glycosyltransferase involved in cell wall biosynthesis
MEPLAPMLRRAAARAVWVQGWQVLAYWQAVWAAKRAGCQVWLRAESNDLAPVAWWKRPAKQFLLGQLFDRIDRFLYIGNANRRLYKGFGVAEERLLPAPYAIDNDRFATQATTLRPKRSELRRGWGIRDDAYCVMFCGKFIEKKRPLDLVAAAHAALRHIPNLHLLFVGSGELDGKLRAECEVAFDAETTGCGKGMPSPGGRPRASFAGFLNQTEISRAYVAADCLVLPSDYTETWGLVVNEAMASCLPCIISDRCGSAEDLGGIAQNCVFRFGDVNQLAAAIIAMGAEPQVPEVSPKFLAENSFVTTTQTVARLWAEMRCKP